MAKILLAGALLISLASANDDLKNKIDNLTSDGLNCVAYFSLISRSPKMSKEYNQYTLKAWQKSDIYSKLIRDDDMVKKVAKARVNNYHEAMIKEIDKDLSNMSILINKYQNECIAYIKDIY
jgi:hypothetical protein